MVGLSFSRVKAANPFPYARGRKTGRWGGRSRAAGERVASASHFHGNCNCTQVGVACGPVSISVQRDRYEDLLPGEAAGLEAGGRKVKRLLGRVRPSQGNPTSGSVCAR